MSIHKLTLAELASAKALIEAVRTIALTGPDQGLFSAYNSPDLSLFRAKVDLMLREQTAEVMP